MAADPPGAPALHQRRLATYLNDRLAVATAGAELARRALSSNEGTRYEEALRRACDGVEADRRLLREVMRSLDVGEDHLKQGAAWLGEKLGRLKPNDALLSYSPLSRVVEVEALAVVLAALRGTWATLDELLGADPRMPGVSGARDRAAADLDAVEALRAPAAAEALLQAG